MEGGREGRRERGKEERISGIILCDRNYGVGDIAWSGCIIRNPSEAG